VVLERHARLRQTAEVRARREVEAAIDERLALARAGRALAADQLTAVVEAVEQRDTLAFGGRSLRRDALADEIAIGELRNDQIAVVGRAAHGAVERGGHERTIERTLLDRLDPHAEALQRGRQSESLQVRLGRIARRRDLLATDVERSDGIEELLRDVHRGRTSLCFEAAVRPPVAGGAADLAVDDRLALGEDALLLELAARILAAFLAVVTDARRARAGAVAAGVVGRAEQAVVARIAVVRMRALACGADVVGADLAVTGARRSVRGVTVGRAPARIAGAVLGRIAATGRWTTWRRRRALRIGRTGAARPGTVFGWIADAGRPAAD